MNARKLPSGSWRCQVYSHTKDVTGNIVNVNKSMVMGNNGKWYIKQPKTYSSYRELEFPDFVIQKIVELKAELLRPHRTRLLAASNEL